MNEIGKINQLTETNMLDVPPPAYTLESVRKMIGQSVRLAQREQCLADLETLDKLKDVYRDNPSHLGILVRCDLEIHEANADLLQRHEERGNE